MRKWPRTFFEIPDTGGTYALLLACPQSRKLRIGRLGDHTIPRGWYIYVGSAFGPGGLKSRCLRHLRALRRLHWHIDYLRPAASLQEIWHRFRSWLFQQQCLAKRARMRYSGATRSNPATRRK